MKCYRVYVNNDLVATVFSLPHAVSIMDTWIASGYSPELRIEKYE